MLQTDCLCKTHKCLVKSSMKKKLCGQIQYCGYNTAKKKNYHEGVNVHGHEWRHLSLAVAKQCAARILKDEDVSECVCVCVCVTQLNLQQRQGYTLVCMSGISCVTNTVPL